MNPGLIPQNMIRLVMVFKSLGFYFTSALWCSLNFIIFPFHICMCSINSTHIASVCVASAYINIRICVFIILYLIFQFHDDKDGSDITKGRETNVPEVFQWQTMKTENEGNRIGLCCRSTFFNFFSANLSNWNFSAIWKDMFCM